jgi:hypothetical protein
MMLVDAINKSNKMQKFGKIYNSFYEMAADTGSLNASALNSIRLYNDTIPAPAPVTSGQQSRANVQTAQQQTQQADPVGNDAEAEPNEFKQNVTDKKNERNF